MAFVTRKRNVLARERIYLANVDGHSARLIDGVDDETYDRAKRIVPSLRGIAKSPESASRGGQ